MTHWVCNAKAQRLCSAGSSIMSHGRHLCSLSPSSKPSQQMWYSCFSEKNPSHRNSFSQSQICRHLLSWCEHREQADVCLKGAFFSAVTFIAGFFQSHNLADWRSFHSAAVYDEFYSPVIRSRNVQKRIYLFTWHA